MAPKAGVPSHPCHCHATPRHATGTLKPSMMALEPRPPTPSMDRTGPFPSGRPLRSRLSPAVRRSARAPRPPRPDRTPENQNGPIIPCTRLSAVSPWPRADYEAGRAGLAPHCPACHVATTEHASHPVAHAPAPRVAVPDSHGQNGAKPRKGRDGGTNGASGRQPQAKWPPFSARRHFHSFPLGFGSVSVRSLHLLSPFHLVSGLCSLPSLWTTPLRGIAICKDKIRKCLCLRGGPRTNVTKYCTSTGSFYHDEP